MLAIILFQGYNNWRKFAFGEKSWIIKILH